MYLCEAAPLSPDESGPCPRSQRRSSVHSTLFPLRGEIDMPSTDGGSSRSHKPGRLSSDEPITFPRKPVYNTAQRSLLSERFRDPWGLAKRQWGKPGGVQDESVHVFFSDNEEEGSEGSATHDSTVNQGHERGRKDAPTTDNHKTGREDVSRRSPNPGPKCPQCPWATLRSPDTKKSRAPPTHRIRRLTSPSTSVGNKLLHSRLLEDASQNCRFETMFPGFNPDPHLPSVRRPSRHSSVGDRPPQPWPEKPYEVI